MEPGGLRRAGAKVFPQGGHPHILEAGPRRRRAGISVAPGVRRRRAHGRAFGEAGVRPHGRHLDLLGLEGRLFRYRSRCARVPRRALLHAGDAEGRTQFAAMVQHRPALGLRHRRPEPGSLLRRSRHAPSAEIELRLRASAAACLLHPGREGRPRKRRRHHGFVDARGASLQIRLGHRHEFLEPCAARTRSFRAAGNPRA